MEIYNYRSLIIILEIDKSKSQEINIYSVDNCVTDTEALQGKMRERKLLIEIPGDDNILLLYRFSLDDMKLQKCKTSEQTLHQKHYDLGDPSMFQDVPMNF